MSYIGFKPIQGNVVVEEFTSSGGSTYTLSNTPSNINSVEVVVGGLTQTSSAYSFVGTTLTLAGVASGTKIIVRQHGEKLLLNTPTTNSVTNATMADDAVGVAELSATGTASSSTFLRGDNSWQTAGSTSASDLTSGTLPIARIANDAIDSRR